MQVSCQNQAECGLAEKSAHTCRYSELFMLIVTTYRHSTGKFIILRHEETAQF